MAKRTRGSNHPGQRRPDRHSPARQQPRPAGRPSQGLSAAEEARAADLAPAGRRGMSPLAVRAAEEYAYVSRDVRRILWVGGSMIGLLGVFFVLIDILHVVTV